MLNFLECGRIKVDQQRRSYDFEIKGAKLFATCNEINRTITAGTTTGTATGTTTGVLEKNIPEASCPDICQKTCGLDIQLMELSLRCCGVQ
jgi:hypothetical protein